MQYSDFISANGTVGSGSYSRKGGGCKFLCATPLAGTVNRNYYRISPCRNAIFWLHFRKRNCRFWIVFPQGGNVDFYKHLHLRRPCRELKLGLIQNLPLRNNILIAFPQAEVFILNRIPARWECRNFIAFLPHWFGIQSAIFKFSQAYT